MRTHYAMWIVPPANVLVIFVVAYRCFALWCYFDHVSRLDWQLIALRIRFLCQRLPLAWGTANCRLLKHLRRSSCMERCESDYRLRAIGQRYHVKHSSWIWMATKCCSSNRVQCALFKTSYQQCNTRCFRCCFRPVLTCRPPHEDRFHHWIRSSTHLIAARE